MTVKPDCFVKSMRKRWSGEYSLKSSKELERAWHEMAVTFNDHIEGNVQEEWSVLRLPTGTGKTQGLALYCSLLSEKEDGYGVLIITRFTAEAENLVKTINQKPYRKTALTNHSKIELEKRPSDKEMKESPVLIITHSAYKNALDASNNHNMSSAWEKFTSFKGGKRKLVVIDETLDTVKRVRIDFDTLRMIRGLVSREMEKENPQQVATFEKVLAKFLDWERKELAAYSKEILEPAFWIDISKQDIAWLRDELCKLPLDGIVFGGREKGVMKRRCKDVLDDLLIILSDRSWYTKKENAHSVNSGYVPLPTHIASAVIMDATAAHNRAYDLLGSIPRFRDLPDGLRSYKNVKLHIFYGYNNGSLYLGGQKTERFVDVLESLIPHISRDKEFFFCTCMKAEKKLDSLKKHYPKMDIGHWGNIDGRNDWQDFDAMVIYGLQRLDEITPEYCIWAYENWHEKVGAKYDRPQQYFETMPDGTVMGHIEDNPAYSVTESDYKKGHLVTSVIQAINRVRCRRVIDDKGNCLPTDIYLLFNKGDELEQAILDGIQEAMPDIQIVENGKPECKTLRMTKNEKNVFEYLQKQEPREYSVDEIKEALDITDRTMERVVKAAKKAGTAFNRRLAEIGFSFKGGRGRYASLRFVRIKQRAGSGG